MQITENDKPEKIVKLGNGAYYYNYNIQNNEETWTFTQVKLWGQPNYKDCVQAVIREFVDENEEFDLVNSANRVILGLDVDESKK